MAGPTTATALLKNRNSFKTHPELKRKDEPKPTAQFNKIAPSYFNENERKAWEQIIDACPPGVLTKADKIMVEMTARIVAAGRKQLLSPGMQGRLEANLSRLGMTPSGRATIRVSQGDDNKFEGF